MTLHRYETYEPSSKLLDTVTQAVDESFDWKSIITEERLRSFIKDQIIPLYKDEYPERTLWFPTNEKIKQRTDHYNENIPYRPWASFLLMYINNFFTAEEFGKQTLKWRKPTNLELSNMLNYLPSDSTTNPEININRNTHIVEKIEILIEKLEEDNNTLTSELTKLSNASDANIQYSSEIKLHYDYERPEKYKEFPLCVSIDAEWKHITRNLWNENAQLLKSILLLSN